LEGIVKSVQRVTDMIEEISTAAREQSSGIDQVNSAVAQMDEMTQQNAALVEEASAAGEAMAEQSRGMMQLMDFFTVDSNAAVSAYVQQPAPQMSAPAAHSPSPSTAGNHGASMSDGDDDEWQEF